MTGIAGPVLTDVQGNRSAAGMCALALALLITGCDGNSERSAASDPPITARTLTASGSSTVYPLTLEAARRFQRERRDADIRVSFTGTTEGFRQFCDGAIDIANASRAIDVTEQRACADAGIDYLEFPVAVDTLAIVTHFNNDWVDHLSTAELRRIWEPAAEGSITYWNQIRPNWPEQPIALYGRGEDSGTYDYFTAVIAGKTRASRKDYAASEDEEWLAAKIAADSNSLGFFGVGAYHRHWESLRVIAIDSGDGPVYPSVETASSGRYQPLSRPLYLYVNRSALHENADLYAFLNSYFSGASRWLHLTGYLPLDAGTYLENRERLSQQ